LNIPNILTTIRFLLVPVFVYFFFSDLENSYFISAIIFIFAGVTDVLDGYIARKCNMITKWGKLLDPLADKLMQLTVIFCLTYRGLVPLWAIYIILTKEILMVLGSILLYRDEIVVSATWYGKAATVLFYLAILAIILLDTSDMQSTFLIGIAVGSGVFAFVRYSLNFKQIKFSHKHNFNMANRSEKNK
jgi:cardiolipin synthase